MQRPPRPEPGSPELVPVDNPVYPSIMDRIASTISMHHAVPRGEGLVGKTCRQPHCAERIIFLTLRDGYNHQAQEIIRAIRMDAGFTPTDGEDAVKDAAYLQSIIELLGLGSPAAPDEGTV